MQHRKRRVPAGPDVRAARCARGSAPTENIGPIASACATAWSVERFRCPRLDESGCGVDLAHAPPPALPRRAPLAPASAARYKVRTSNVNHRGAQPAASRALRRGSRLRRDPRADRRAARWRPAHGSVRRSSPISSGSPAAPFARRCAGSRETGWWSSRSTAASSWPTSGSRSCSSGSRPASCSSRQIARLAAVRRTEADLEALREAISDERAATTSDAAHDASRAFHLALAAATRERAAVAADRRPLDRGRRPALARPPLCGADMAGRRRPRARGDPGGGRRGRRGRAEDLLRRHDEDALRHWSDQQHPGG